MENANRHRLHTVVKLAKITTDKIINKADEGILKKPTTAYAIEEFNNTVNDIVTNKIRKKLGV